MFTKIDASDWPFDDLPAPNPITIRARPMMEKTGAIEPGVTPDLDELNEDPVVREVNAAHAKAAMDTEADAAFLAQVRHALEEQDPVTRMANESK